jgi:hypothetical protein
VAQEPRCPECDTEVRPSWDWCMACGFDPASLKPTGWKPGTPTPVSVASVAPEAAALGATTVTLVREAQPQEMSDPDWVQAPTRGRVSFLTMMGLLAVILIAITGVIVVILMVLHHPIGTTSADALGLPGSPLSGPVAAAAG